MKIKVAESAGFCFGVARAVAMCRETCEKGSCYTLGPLINNKDVTDELEDLGAKIVHSVSEIPEGSTVIIRAHGIGKKAYEELLEKNLEIINATCTYVSKIHEIVQMAEADGRTPVIIGERDHPEIIGISGWCSDCQIFETAEELLNWLENTDKNGLNPLTVVFQTTETRKKFERVEEILKKECTNYKIFDTICNATNHRQREAKALAEESDAFIVIGGRNSANSRRLADIAREVLDRVFFIENGDELELQWFEPEDTVGITAGASTPDRIIKEVNQKMIEETKTTNGEIENNAEQINEEAAALEINEEETPETVEVSADSQADAAADSVEEPAEEATDVADTEETEEVEEEDRPLTFEEMLEQSIKTLHSGERVTGIVAAVTPTEITVDLGTKQSGYIPLAEFTDDSSVKIEDVVNVGDEIEAIVLRINDVEGTVMLSRRRLEAMKTWNDIQEAMEKKTIVEGIVKEDNKGGVVVMIRGIRVFVPASRTGLPRSAAMSELLKQKVRLIITEVNQPRRRVVGSISAVLNEERKAKAEEVWAEIEEGKRYKGTVKSLTSYGAFVDIGGVDGMVHVSEISWTHIAKPADVLSVGDEIEVYVINFDTEKKRISLGYKDPNLNPWVKFSNGFQIGDVTPVKIVKLMKFGAFAEIIAGVDGLIHISQISNRRIAEPGEVLAEGDLVDVKIVDIDNENQKVSLSIRALLDQPAREVVRERSESAIVYSTDAPMAFSDDDDLADDE